VRYCDDATAGGWHTSLGTTSAGLCLISEQVLTRAASSSAGSPLALLIATAASSPHCLGDIFCNRYTSTIEELSTTHELVRQDRPLGTEQVVSQFFDWSAEKKAKFTPQDVLLSLEVLSKEGIIERQLHGYVSRMSPWRNNRREEDSGDSDPLRA
jgi:hypothetical protein